MPIRKIKKIFPSQPTMEGAGVRLRRGFGQVEVPQFDPFLLLDDFGSKNPEDYLLGFPWHPHRGIETVTYIIRGSVEHKDSLGNEGTINNGDVQWMTAGSGVIHQEMPQRYNGESKGFQLWVNLPKKHKMTDPRYRGIFSDEIPNVITDKMTVKVIAGTYENKTGPVIDLMVDVKYLDVSLKAGADFEYSIPKHYTAFLYVFEGSICVEESDAIGDGIVILTDSGDTIKVTAKYGDTRFIVVAGEPIGENVAWRGPIVMNTKEELQQAFTEYQNGTFVK